MTSRLFGIGAVVALVGVTNAFGCGTSPRDEATQTSTADIQGGTTDSTHTFEVGVCLGSPGNCQAICTGTLIAPNLVATARHCVAQVPSGPVDCASTRFGSQYSASSMYVTTNQSIFTSSGTWARGTKIITPTPTLLCGNDIALIILATSIPSGAATPVTPNVMYSLVDRNYISKLEDTAIGYGLTAPNTNTAGTRHIRQHIAFNCMPGDRFYDCKSKGYTDIADQEFFSGDGPCEGDSGSGAFSQGQFDQGQFLSLGVLSRGGVSLDGLTCVGSIYTRLDSYRDLIINAGMQAATMGGYTPPAWVNSPPIPPVTIDGGTKPPADSGSSGGDGGDPPAPGELGAPCDTDADCNSNACKALNGGDLVCTDSCDSKTACPDGFVCKYNYCFAGSTSSGNQAQSSGSSGGCAVVQRDPSKPIPWLLGMIGFALAGAAVRRKRRP